MRRVEVLISIAIVAVCVLLLWVVISRGRKESNVVLCMGNLHHIYSAGSTFAIQRGNGWFPVAPGQEPRAHESLNMLIVMDILEPTRLICPMGEGVPAERDTRGKLELKEENVSYSWVKAATRDDENRALSSDKYFDGLRDSRGTHLGHIMGMNVIYTDGRVEFVRKEQLTGGKGLPDGLVH